LHIVFVIGKYTKTFREGDFCGGEFSTGEISRGEEIFQEKFPKKGG
jgi:hypothetical protein